MIKKEEVLTVLVPEMQDYKKVCVLAKQIQNLHVRWRPDIFVKTEKPLDITSFLLMVTRKSIYVVKNAKEDILGYVTFKVELKENCCIRTRKQLYIETICVDKKYRKKGIGSILMERVKELAKENECTDIVLSVNEENKVAMALYEKMGMKVKQVEYSMQI